MKQHPDAISTGYDEEGREVFVITPCPDCGAPACDYPLCNDPDGISDEFEAWYALEEAMAERRIDAIADSYR